MSDQALGKGPGHAQVQDAGGRKNFFGVLVRDTASDDAQLPVAVLDAIEGKRFRSRRHVAHALLDGRVALAGIGGHHNILGGVARELVDFGWHFHAFSQLDGAAGVADACGHA